MSTERRYDPKTVEPKWQALWERERHVGGLQRRGRRRVLRRRDAALPIRGAAHGAPQELRGRRRRRALPAACRAPRAASHRLRRVRAAGREPCDQERRASARLDRGVDRRLPARVPLLGRVVRLVARGRHQRADLLPLDAVDLPQALRARARLPLRRRRSTGARRTRPCSPTSRSSTAAASAAGRRSRRASSSSGSSASPTTPTACSTTSTTVEWPSHVVRMQQNWIGRSEGAEVQFSRARDGHRLPRLHDAARTRCSARRSSSWRPSTPTCCASPRARSTRRRSATTSTTR